jgi:hypothetical protein
VGIAKTIIPVTETRQRLGHSRHHTAAAPGSFSQFCRENQAMIAPANAAYAVTGDLPIKFLQIPMSCFLPQNEQLFLNPDKQVKLFKSNSLTLCS